MPNSDGHTTAELARLSSAKLEEIIRTQERVRLELRAEYQTLSAECAKLHQEAVEHHLQVATAMEQFQERRRRMLDLDQATFGCLSEENRLRECWKVARKREGTPIPEPFKCLFAGDEDRKV